MHCGTSLADVAPVEAESSPLGAEVPWENPPWLSDPTWGGKADAAPDPAPPTDSATAPAPENGGIPVWGEGDVAVTAPPPGVGRIRARPPKSMLVMGAAAVLLIGFSVLQLAGLGKHHAGLSPADKLVAPACSSYVKLQDRTPGNAAARAWYVANAPVFDRAVHFQAAFKPAADAAHALATAASMDAQTAHLRGRPIDEVCGLVA